MRIFQPKRETITGQWKKKWILSTKYIISVIISKRVRWTRHVECMRKMRNLHKTTVGKSE
jgi:hypothetical protein